MDLKKGLIHLQQIRKDAIEHSFNSATPEAWLLHSLANAAPKNLDMEAHTWAQSVQIQGQMRVARIDPEYMVEGSFQAQVPALCSRCGDNFETERKGEFRLFYKPLEKGQSLDEESSDDPDYNFLTKEHINLADILSEQIVVQEPLAECPDRKEDGTCLLCGKNPQFAGQE